MTATGAAARPGQMYLHFKGWATIRLPTDPDPADEPRGASGYTFAFANELPLDRQIRLQPMKSPQFLRDGAPWKFGVFVDQCFTILPDGTRRDISGVVGAPVDWLGQPRLENRNWLFTLPGWEPIVPFEFQVTLGGGVLQRLAPLAPGNPPAYKVPRDQLMAQGAAGVNLEPETVGTATGIWDAYALVAARKPTLEALLAKAPTPAARAIYTARLQEVEYALANPYDRRIMAHYGVERFSFPINGPNALVPSSGPLSGLDPAPPWSVSFFLAAFDVDTFSMWIQGVLAVPFRPSFTPADEPSEGS